MKNKTWSVLMVAGLCVASLQTASATSISPSYDSFGSLPTATFGGTGIDNSSVAKATYNDGDGTKVHFGIEAFGRYSNPIVGNNGAGTYFATAGFNDGLDGGGHSSGPTWDIGIFLQGVSGSVDLALHYTDSVTGADHIFDFGHSTVGTYQDSYNLSMSFLGDIGFNPYANGTYGFELLARDDNGGILGRDAINVNVTGGTNSVPDGGSTLAMIGFAAGGLFIFKRAKQRGQVPTVSGTL